MNKVVSITNLSHSYSEGNNVCNVISDIELAVNASEFVVLAGPSGCGKTTLLSIIGGFVSAQSGSVNVLGKELVGISPEALTDVRRDIGLVFQSSYLMSFLNVLENVMLPLDAPCQPDRSYREKKELAYSLLSEMGIDDKAYSNISQLSGGQRQRVGIARAFITSPRLILADEPTASLDYPKAIAIMDSLREMANNQMVSIVMTTHDQRLFDYADHVVFLDGEE